MLCVYLQKKAMISTVMIVLFTLLVFIVAVTALFRIIDSGGFLG